jgi:hypothetical protein
MAGASGYQFQGADRQKLFPADGGRARHERCGVCSPGLCIETPHSAQHLSDLRSRGATTATGCHSPVRSCARNNHECRGLPQSTMPCSRSFLGVRFSISGCRQQDRAGTRSGRHPHILVSAQLLIRRCCDVTLLQHWRICSVDSERVGLALFPSPRTSNSINLQYHHRHSFLRRTLPRWLPFLLRQPLGLGPMLIWERARQGLTKSPRLHRPF